MSHEVSIIYSSPSSKLKFIQVGVLDLDKQPALFSLHRGTGSVHRDPTSLANFLLHLANSSLVISFLATILCEQAMPVLGAFVYIITPLCIFINHSLQYPGLLLSQEQTPSIIDGHGRSCFFSCHETFPWRGSQDNN